MVIFSIIRSGKLAYMTARTKYALVLFVITINIFTAQIWASFCRRLSPIKYEDVLYLEDGDDEHLQPYLPTVLQEPGKRIIASDTEDTSSQQNNSGESSPGAYGTFSNDLDVFR